MSNRKRKVTINGITYNGSQEAMDALNISYTTLWRYKKEGIAKVKVINNGNKIKNPQYLNNIDFSKEHSYSEIGRILLQLGLVDNKSQASITNIQFWEKQAIKKLKEKMLETLTEDEIKTFFKNI